MDRALLQRINADILQSVLKAGEKYKLKHLLRLLREYLEADLVASLEQYALSGEMATSQDMLDGVIGESLLPFDSTIALFRRG